MERWFGLPRVLRIAIFVLGWFGYALLVLSLNTPESAHRIAMFVGIACVAAAAITTVLDERVQSNFGSAPRFNAYRQALRTGELPADIDVGEWQRWLRGSALRNATGFLLAGPFVLFGFMSSAFSPTAFHWIPAAAFALLTVCGFAAMPRSNARIRRLTAKVKRRRNSLHAVAGTSSKLEGADKLREGGFASSLPERLVGGCLVWFVCILVVLLLADLQSLVYGGPRILRLEWALGCAALVAVAWAVLGEERHLRRNFASFEDYTEYNRMVRAGELPADMKAEVWRRRVQTRRRENLFRLLLACFFIALGIASILTDQSPYHWMTAALFQVIAIWLLVNWWAGRARLTALAAQVERNAIRQSWG
jgi:hypothetical protein